MRKWIIFLIAFIIIGIVGYNYIYQDHRDIESETAEFSIPSSELSTFFADNAVTAEQKFLNKTIEITGRISDLNTNDLTIDDNVFCQFSDDIKTALDKNDKAKIKGRVIGYDDLLEQVKLDQCIIINHK